ncbi:MAG: DUF2089 domain-containing protein [Actinomycetota bacterium]|nr:DUF2089 domain-containing protein [Actinomycetota bacterium]
MYPLPTTCPVCGGPFHAERLGCDRCHAALEGRFTLGWLGHLSREQLDFVELLVKNRGNINGVAGELKIAYNTARSRLDDIVAALGYGAPAAERRASRREVLDRLSAGEISVEEATQLLRG